MEGTEDHPVKHGSKTTDQNDELKIKVADNENENNRNPLFSGRLKSRKDY